jgi:hypothetical protein
MIHAYVSILNVHAAFPCCFFMLHAQLYVHSA